MGIFLRKGFSKTEASYYIILYKRTIEINSINRKSRDNIRNVISPIGPPIQFIK